MSRWTDDDDVTANYHRGNPYSVEAHESIKAAKEAGQRLVRRMLEETYRADGLSCDEFEVITGMIHQSASARFSELKRDGVIVEITKRPTRRGRAAAVFGLVRYHNTLQPSL